MNLSPSAIRKRAVSIAVALSMAFAPMVRAADRDKGNVPVVRDAEIEALVSDYARPLLKAAGLSRSGIQIVLVNSPDFNAFVNGRRIFVNTGAITQTGTPNQLIGILSHEIGHLAGGHQNRLRQQLEQAKTMAIVAGLLGAGVAVAGAASGSREAAQAGTGVMAGGSGVAMRSLLRYQRGEEATADRSALTYLRKTGQSPKGLLETFQTLERNSMFGRHAGYLSSHPAPRDRIATLQEAAQASPDYDRKDPEELRERHDRARAKIAAYSGSAGDVRRLFARNPRGLAALYGDAIATYLAGSTDSALEKLGRLIDAQPKSPWFQEMRGQILMDAGRGKEAAAAFSRAAALDGSGSGILKAEVGQALVTSGDRSRMEEAVRLIRAGLRSDPLNFTAYRFLAMAYGSLGDIGHAELATAEGYWHGGSYREAMVFAARAQQKLKPNSPAWRQAQDIIDTKMPSPTE